MRFFTHSWGTAAHTRACTILFCHCKSICRCQSRASSPRTLKAVVSFAQVPESVPVHVLKLFFLIFVSLCLSWEWVASLFYRSRHQLGTVEAVASFAPHLTHPPIRHWLSGWSLCVSCLVLQLLLQLLLKLLLLSQLAPGQIGQLDYWLPCHCCRPCDWRQLRQRVMRRDAYCFWKKNIRIVVIQRQLNCLGWKLTRQQIFLTEFSSILKLKIVSIFICIRSFEVKHAFAWDNPCDWGSVCIKRLLKPRASKHIIIEYNFGSMICPAHYTRFKQRFLSLCIMVTVLLRLVAKRVFIMLKRCGFLITSSRSHSAQKKVRPDRLYDKVQRTGIILA